MNNQLLLEAAQRFQTPLYIYDEEVIKKQYEKLNNAFSEIDAKIFYACKALSNINILKVIKGLGGGLDCVSIQEVKLGLMAGFIPQQIIFTPNCVDFEEIKEGIELGLHVNIDNISILEQFGNEYGDRYPILIRINPHIVAGGNHKISTGHIDSKFGISIHQIRHVERIINSTGIHVEGLHMHTGSEIKDVNTFMLGLEVLMGILHLFPDVKYIDLGSGFKVAYKEDESETDIELLGEKLEEVLANIMEEYGRKIEFWFEPGKFLVAECGKLLVKANVIKQTTATVFIGVNSGFNHLIRPMFYDAYHKITNASNENGNKRIYTIVGNICETDTFAWDRKLSEVKEGDILVIHDAGAYGFEMSSSFNSRNRPAEVIYINGELILIRKRECMDDLLRNQILLEEGNCEN